MPALQHPSNAVPKNIFLEAIIMAELNSATCAVSYTFCRPYGNVPPTQRSMMDRKPSIMFGEPRKREPENICLV